MRLQFGHQDCLDLPSLSSYDELVHQLNDLLGNNTYTIERDGRKVSLDEEHALSDDETYTIWPRVLGGKVSSIQGVRRSFSVECGFSFRVVSARCSVRLVNRFSSRRIRRLAVI